jgi:hypothetical protein
VEWSAPDVPAFLRAHLQSANLPDAASLSDKRHVLKRSGRAEDGEDEDEEDDGALPGEGPVIVDAHGREIETSLVDALATDKHEPQRGGALVSSSRKSASIKSRALPAAGKLSKSIPQVKAKEMHDKPAAAKKARKNLLSFGDGEDP